MIQDTFLKLKSNLELNDTFSDTVSRQHNAVRSVIENNGQNVKDTKLIGSLHKLRQTRIQPQERDIFDIDILVILGEFDRWVPLDQGTTPQMAMDHVHSIVKNSQRYGAMGPQQDHPTVTFEYANNVKVELVPAYLDKIGHTPSGVTHQPIGRAYWIPNTHGSWDLADYDYDAEYISAINQNSNGLFIPTVKMLKAIKRKHFPMMKSFHLEVIAAYVIPATLLTYKQRGITPSYPGLLADFIHSFETYLPKQLRLPGSNSSSFQIDALTQLQISQSLPFLKEWSKKALFVATDADKHFSWRQIFGDIFPLS